ncbi:hypothetical protein RDI58_003202 [Solanum bulbocastanum]|jgi:hypothetical protein
MTTG